MRASLDATGITWGEHIISELLMLVMALGLMGLCILAILLIWLVGAMIEFYIAGWCDDRRKSRIHRLDTWKDRNNDR